MDATTECSVRWIMASLFLHALCGAAMYGFLVLIHHASAWDPRFLACQAAMLATYLAALLCAGRAGILIGRKAQRTSVDLLYLATSLLLALTLGLCVLVILCDGVVLLDRQRHARGGMGTPTAGTATR